MAIKLHAKPNPKAVPQTCSHFVVVGRHMPTVCSCWVLDMGLDASSWCSLIEIRTHVNFAPSTESLYQMGLARRRHRPAQCRTLFFLESYSAGHCTHTAVQHRDRSNARSLETTRISLFYVCMYVRRRHACAGSLATLSAAGCIMYRLRAHMPP